MSREAAAETQASRARHKPGGLLGTLRSIAIPVAVALSIRAFLFEPFSIPSGSMLPTLQIGDYVIVTKFAYGVRVPFTNELLWDRGKPERGDVIVFERPTPTAETLIKRVVGLPGDEIRLVDNRLYINGQAQPRKLREADHALDDYDERRRRWFATRADLYVEQFAPDEAHFVLEQRHGPSEEGPFRVPAGSVMVLGDNRDNSMDSRAWGFVPVGHIRGRADLIGFSWGEDGLRTDRLFRGVDAGVEAPEGD